MSCIFCLIRDGAIPAVKIFETDTVYVIRDIEPKAKEHLLVIPKVHFESVASDAILSHPNLLNEMTIAAKAVVKQIGLKDGFRLVINTGSHAGQTVFHLHMHVLGGEILGDRFF